MKLSNRLASIANEIKKGETMVDIGCDHGLLPFALLQRQISPKVIMADISPGSLDKAKFNFRIHSNKLPLNSLYEFRLGNGLDVIDLMEVDKIVIAGMGGNLIVKILENNLKKAKNAKGLILQPRNSAWYLRKWLTDNGFHIAKEKLVKEGKFICEIIIAVYNPEKVTADDYCYPCIYALREWENNTTTDKLSSRRELLKEYLKRCLVKEKYIFEQMEKAKVKNITDIKNQKGKINRLKRLLEVSNEDQ